MDMSLLDIYIFGAFMGLNMIQTTLLSVCISKSRSKSKDVEAAKPVVKGENEYSLTQAEKKGLYSTKVDDYVMPLPPLADARESNDYAEIKQKEEVEEGFYSEIPAAKNGPLYLEFGKAQPESNLYMEQAKPSAPSYDKLKHMPEKMRKSMQGYDKVRK